MPRVLSSSKQCHAAVVHPINGEGRISVKWFDLADFLGPEDHQLMIAVMMSIVQAILISWAVFSAGCISQSCRVDGVSASKEISGDRWRKSTPLVFPCGFYIPLSRRIGGIFLPWFLEILLVVRRSLFSWFFKVISIVVTVWRLAGQLSALICSMEWSLCRLGDGFDWALNMSLWIDSRLSQMPLINIRTNISDVQAPDALLKRLSAALATSTGKSESYVCLDTFGLWRGNDFRG